LVRDLHMAFKPPYIHDYTTKLCRQQAEVIQNHENKNVRNIEQGEPRHGKYNRLKLSAVKHTTAQVTSLLFKQELLMIGHDLLYLAWTDRGLVYVVHAYI
jgi:hypothetical protein